MLTPRLQAIADFVPKNSFIADIGTDHANLPVELIKSKIITRAIAADINKGPYHIAKKAVQNNCLKSQIDVRLGNGLSVLKPFEVEIAVLAGMGGLLIISLLESSPEIITSLHGLILQPQLAADKLRRYLYEIGWHIEDENLAKEQRHLYQIIYAVPGVKEMPNDTALEIGPVLLQKKPPLFDLHIDELLRRNKKIQAGLACSLTKENREQYEKTTDLIKNLEMIKNG